MGMDFIEQFKIPFYQFKISDWENKKEKLLDLYYGTEKNLTNTDPNSNVYTDFFGRDNYVDVVSEIFYDDLVNFVKKIKSPCRISSAWFQKYIKGCFHSPHNHGALGYSSVCFIKYDENEHQPTRFMCPFNSHNGRMLEYVPENITEGTIIIFPAMLTHYVLPTSSDKERIIISMNIESKN